MKNLILGLLICALWSPAAIAQSYKSVSSKTIFFSSAPLEDITAENKQATGLFNGETGAIAFRIPIKGFVFRKSLMQQHFNENYMESHKYPNATFEGKLLNYDLKRQGTQKVDAEGLMTIHGVTQKVKIQGDFTVSGNGLKMESVFDVRLEDYDIDIPRVVFLNIAEVVEVTVLYQFEQM